MTEGEPIDLASAFLARQKAHYLISVPDDEVRNVIVGKQMAGLRMELDGLLKNPDRFGSHLRAFRKVFFERERSYTVPELCTKYIGLRFHHHAYSLAAQGLEQNNLATFAFWFDVAYGISILEVVSLGREYQNSTFDQRSAEAIDRISEKFGLSMGKTVEGYLRLVRRAKRAAILLQKDPTGFRVINDQVKGLKTSPHDVIGRGWLIPEFVIAGAEFAQKAYKGIYPLAEECLAN